MTIGMNERVGQVCTQREPDLSDDDRKILVRNAEMARSRRSRRGRRGKTESKSKRERLVMAELDAMEETMDGVSRELDCRSGEGEAGQLEEWSQPVQ